MDDGPRLTVGGEGPSFNSATALKPWMTPSATVADAGDGRLQFGHGVEAVDDRAAIVGVVASDAGSFNSATALKPWMTLASEMATRERVTLPISSGPQAVGSLSAVSNASNSRSRFSHSPLRYARGMRVNILGIKGLIVKELRSRSPKAPGS